MYKILLFVIIIAGVGGCLQEEVEEEKSILVYSSECMKKPMTDIGQMFEQREGIKVEYVFGGSGALMHEITEWERGDVYMPGSESYARQAEELGYFETYVIVARHPLTIIVPKKNQVNIKTIYDLTNDSVRIGLGDPETTAVGKMTFKIFENANITSKIMDNYVVLYESDCADMMPTLLEGETDVAINCIPSTYEFIDKVVLIDIPPEVNLERMAPIGVLTFSEDMDSAAKFVDFAASEEGKAIFKKYGFAPLEG
ncbi:MAG: molybdate ABC transporter substrate-binding protein [Candidatus Hydrothermarchaeaceae archaeon]